MRRKPRNIVIIAVVACATTCAMLFITERTVNHEKIITPIPTVAVPTGKPDVEGATVAGAKRVGYRVSWYGQEYCDKYNPRCITASGEKFDENAFTCACADWIPLHSRILVSHEGRSVVVQCNDRGNFEGKGRVLDLSKASFAELAPVSKGVIDVEIEVIGKEEL